MSSSPPETEAAPSTGTPRKLPPSGSCDCHTHLFGPFAAFPPKVPSTYALPLAGPEVHEQMRTALGVDRAVLVQPAPYAQDASAMLAAIAQAKGNLRGVGVADDTVAADTLADWAERGIRGLRFVEMRAPTGQRYPGSVSFDDLSRLAPAMREIGLHANLWAPMDVLVEQLPALAKLGIPLVLDHMAMIDPALGPGDSGVRRLVEIIKGNDVWTKLALCRVERADLTGGKTVHRIHDLLVEACPERLIWGSDWPYVRLDPAPDAAAMLNLFVEWVSDDRLIRRILVDNPATLYDF